MGSPLSLAALRAISPRSTATSKVKRIALGGVAVAIMACGWAAISRGNANEMPPFQTAPVTRGDLTAVVTATGSIQAKTEVEVGAELSGLIREVNVDFNSAVSKGQALAVFDPSEYEAQVAQCRADLAAAVASRASATASAVESDSALTRVSALAKQGWVTGQALETARAGRGKNRGDLAAASARVTLAQAALDASLSKLRKTRVLSPIDGTVLDRVIQPGQVVVAALQTPRLFTLVGSLDTMTLTADVAEADIAAIQQGQNASFTVEAYPQRSFAGTVTQIRNAPRKTDGVLSYQVVVTVANRLSLLKPGMTATIAIVTSHDRAALQVPNTALRFTPPGQQAYRAASTTRGIRHGQVWIQEPTGKLRPLQLVLGPSDGRTTEVVGGSLMQDQQVLTSLRADEQS